MNIWQINVVGGSGSTGRLAAGIDQALRERGHRGTLAFGRGEAPPGSRSCRLGPRASVAAHVLHTRLTDRHGFASAASTRALLRRMEAERPDVIHLHNLHGYYLHVGLLFNWLKRTGIPVLWTLHDCWAFTGHCAFFDFADCPRWETGCHHCPQVKSYPASWGADASVRNWRDKRALFTDVPHLTLVTPSRWLGELADRSFLGGYPIHVVPNGVDRTLFRPRPEEGAALRRRFGIGGEETLLLAAANVWEPRKGLRHLEELASRLPEGVRLAVAGLAPGQGDGLPSSVVRLPRIAGAEEMAAWYSAADAFVNPTREDNFPSVDLEAMACGTPVAAFDTGGVAEALDEATGRVVRPGDSAALLAAALELVSEDRREACVDRVAQRYDGRLQFQQYVELYESILDRYNERQPL